MRVKGNGRSVGDEGEIRGNHGKEGSFEKSKRDHHDLIEGDPGFEDRLDIFESSRTSRCDDPFGPVHGCQSQSGHGRPL